MFSTRILVGAAAMLSLLSSSTADTFSTANKNLALYYGQGPLESGVGLAHFCQEQFSPDIIPIGFLNYYFAQGNGYPGSNFGSNCYADVYTGPGYNGVNNTANNHLYSNCPSISNGSIGTCQSLGKKILLSIGGATATYTLMSDAEGSQLADFVWGAFGPANATWTKLGLPRPFDYKGAGGKTIVNVVDGFDFDIEHIALGEHQSYYVTMINRLQTLFAAAKAANAASKTYYITGAPQCAVKDLMMGNLILQAKFDLLFVQFYNTAACSARKWVTGNPNYATWRKEVTTTGFSYDAWVSSITGAGSLSANAKIYVGLLGSTQATTADPSYYLSAAEAKPLIQAMWCKPNFGGVSIWEAMYAENNKAANGNPYQGQIKYILSIFATGTSSINCASPTPTCGSSVCTQLYTVVSGNTCAAIATKYGLTMTQFTALNPQWTTTTCPGLQIGTTLCVKGQAACAKRDLGQGPMQIEAMATAAPTIVAGDEQGTSSRVKRHLHNHQHIHEHKH